MCHRAKHVQSKFPNGVNRSSELFELIHYDIWGPYKVSSSSRPWYFLAIVNDYSRMVWLYLLHEKSRTQRALINFCKLIKNQFNRSIEIVRSDNGQEFLSRDQQEYFTDNNIIHQTSCIDTPQQNGRVEWKHCHILNVAWALLFQTCLPMKFWGEAVAIAT